MHVYITVAQYLGFDIIGAFSHYILSTSVKLFVIFPAELIQLTSCGFQEVFHSGISEYCITVLSSSYEQSPMRKQSLVEFQRQSQQPKANHLEQFMFQQILGRVLAIELGNEPNYFAFRQRQNLLSYIDRLMTERENEPFVPQMKCMELCYNAGAGVISSVSRAVRSWFQ